ncbi:DUF4112 domain-containing protein [Psychrobacter sp. YP14]|uniref:DUF4112 domain-containing protein n=1 Tax=Psychrobacter sanguinis TaxID=861445 RepID=A0A844LYJ2_9GAMM|nr:MULTISPECIES: DUF4112 domain-containing protein [Psychrobacter]AWT48511.1 DUF4112 domain-containing protein [Psychrobacter sp. YP14]MUG31337.1 DUF4112 domain-containing protein [Psychrobacter sanguinis]
MAKPFKSDLSLDAKLAAHQRFEQNLLKQGLTKQQVVEMERKLAKFANTMDSVVRIPFTNQGVGADAALSTVPIAGDVAGLLLTGYAFMLGIKLGVPAKKLTPAVRLALIDLVVGVVPVAGTVMDVFLRPSRKTLQIVREHMQQEYGITDTTHVDRPFMHQALQKKQQQAKFWRNPLVAWLYLHVPDILGLIVLILLGLALWAMLSWIMGWVL